MNGKLLKTDTTDTTAKRKTRTYKEIIDSEIMNTKITSINDKLQCYQKIYCQRLCEASLIVCT